MVREAQVESAAVQVELLAEDGLLYEDWTMRLDGSLSWFEPETGTITELLTEEEYAAAKGRLLGAGTPG